MIPKTILQGRYYFLTFKGGEAREQRDYTLTVQGHTTQETEMGLRRLPERQVALVYMLGWEHSFEGKLVAQEVVGRRWQ